MFEALRNTGELWRPRQANQTGRCSCCNQGMASELPPGLHRAYRWNHDCVGPGDRWMEALAGLLGRCGFEQHPGGLVYGRSCVLLAEGWSTGGADPEDAEEAARHAGLAPIWLVDSRDIALAFGSSVPGLACPSWVMGAAWSEFTTTWLHRTTAPVVLHMRNVAAGYPDNPPDAVLFAVEDPFLSPVVRRGGELSGVPATGAHGRATTLRDFVGVAKHLPGLAERRVTLAYFDGSAHVKRSVCAPFSAAPRHTLDLDPWMSEGGVMRLRDRTFAAHQRMMAARGGPGSHKPKET